MGFFGFGFVMAKVKINVKDKTEQTCVQQWSYFQGEKLGDMKHSHWPS